jgi:hypothetical protein
MGIQYFKNVSETIQHLFDDDIVENSSLLTPSPFQSLLLPKSKIAFHIVSLNIPFLSVLESTFFYDWANHAEKQGIQPIHIWEDRWLSQQDIIHSQLSSLAKKTKVVFARNTFAKRISQPMANDFLNQHHLGGSPNARYKYGLFHKKSKELLGVATFSAPRKFIRGKEIYRSYELVRYGSQLNTTITGGLSKLLKTFIKEVQPDDIMTYADRDWWTGRSYAPLGFKMVEVKPPLQFWVKLTENKRYTTSQLSRLLKDKLDAKANKQVQFANLGYISIHNSGSRKFLYTLK